jgi:hypothetical protein
VSSQWNVDYDRDVFLIYDGPLGSILHDTADTARDVISIVGSSAEWTDKARAAARPRDAADQVILKRISVTDKAVEDSLEKISELNIKVVNLANKLEAHLNEADAHNVAILHRSKK